MEKLIEMMRVAFANNFMLYTQTHNFHLNVTGPDFPEYHKFLNDAYENFQDLIDTYAEKIRQLGAYPELDVVSIQANSQLAPQTEIVTDSVAIFQTLALDIDTCINHIQDTYAEAGVQREYGIQNFLADRQDELRQLAWQIQAILGGE